MKINENLLQLFAALFVIVGFPLILILVIIVPMIEDLS